MGYVLIIVVISMGNFGAPGGRGRGRGAREGILWCLSLWEQKFTSPDKATSKEKPE